MKAPIVEAMMAPGTDRVRKPVKVRISSEGIGEMLSAAIKQGNGDIAIVLNQLRDCLVHDLYYL